MEFPSLKILFEKLTSTIVSGTIIARLNGFNICFNIRSTITLLNQMSAVRLNRSFNIVESVKNVESVLNQIKIGLNFHSTSIQHFLSSVTGHFSVK